MSEATATTPTIKPPREFLETTIPNIKLEPSPLQIMFDDPQQLEETSLKKFQENKEWSLDLLKISEVTPPPRVAFMVEAAKKIILQYLGLEIETNLAVMKVAFIKAETYEKVFDQSSTGVCLVYDNTVYVKYQPELFFDFDMSLTAIHELIHRWLELQINTYDAPSNEGQSTINMSVARSGLVVRKIIRENLTGKINTIKTTGALFNELINYAWEAAIRKELSKDENLEKMFLEEYILVLRHISLHAREKHADSYLFSAHDLSGNEFEVHIEGKNLLFTKDWQIQGTSIYFQIVSDLSSLIPRVDGTPFSEALFKLKLNPRLQHPVRKVITQVLGKDFYHVLHTAKNDVNTLFALLAEIQKKMQ